MHKERKGFTLVEAIMAIALIAVLAALLFKGVQSAIGYARDTRCLANLRNVGGLLLTYANDNNATLPSRQLQMNGVRVYYWMEPLKSQGYVRDFAPNNPIFSCPSGIPSKGRNECYGLRAWEGQSVARDAELPLSRIPNRSEFFLLADSLSYGGGKSEQWYVIQKKGHNNGVHLRHRGLANTFFSDGHSRPMGRDYFETIHLSDPYLTKDPFEAVTKDPNQ